MKRCLLFFMLVCFSSAPASFYARHLTDSGHGWSRFDLKQLSCEVEAFGLFYQTTVTFAITVAPYSSGEFKPGPYEITWDFNLIEGAVITDCWIKSFQASEFTRAEIVDLTSAEKRYQQQPNSQPRLLLRHRWYRNWNGDVQKRFVMNFSPVSVTQYPTIKIRFLSPCLPYYNVRRIILPLDELYTNVQSTAPVLLVRDHDNPNSQPTSLAGNAGSWAKNGEFWRAQTQAAKIILGLAPESATRSYLRTCRQDHASFYQLSVLPPVDKQKQKPRNIMLAIDLTNQQNNYAELLLTLKRAAQLSLIAADSVSLIYSGFSPIQVDTLFAPYTADRLNNLFSGPQNQSAPVLNTLPQLLREAVGFFNRKNKGGEIWLLSDANRHCDPLVTAMEIIQQTHGQAVKPIVFRIISADMNWYYYQMINSQVYYGNEYLYENLARVSWGNFVKLRNAAVYEHLDIMLDAVAPTVNTVEIDPAPVSGLAYSRFQLNQGRTNFPITMPYYEIGLYDGDVPFNVRYYGSFQGALFAETVNINRQTADPGWQAVVVYWFDRYIQNLLLEPQSYETINYIENTSVTHRLLTPYSGFIVPGASGQPAFMRLEETTETAVETPEPLPNAAPQQYDLAAFPNPFNASTTLCISLPDFDDTQPVLVRIVNFLGQQVYECRIQASARSNLKVIWDGRDPFNRPAGSGVYLVRVQAGQFVKNIKISLIK